MATRIAFSAAEDSFHIASRELRDCFGRQTDVERLGPDIGALSAPGLQIADIAQACDEHRVVLIKHLFSEAARIPASPMPKLSAIADAAAEAASAGPADLSVQAWVSGRNTLEYGPGDLSRAVNERLLDEGHRPGRAGNDHVLSVCITPDDVLIGFNETRFALSDWPGGRVRLFRGDEQVSRSEFKLEELLQAFPVELPSHGVAVDYGAAPGGWTRILRQRGLDVIAVDPGDLDARVAEDRGVRHLRTTAGEFLRSNRRRLDLAVNDMRMDPLLSAQLMVSTAEHLRRGATAVVTLKVGSHEVLGTLDRCLGLLGGRGGKYEIVAARQLHHNRKEITTLLRRR